MTVPYLFDVTPRFSDTDAYGVVHHSNYYRWFEEARIQFLFDVFGLTFRDFAEVDLKLLVLESSCTHQMPVQHGDPLTIELKMSVPKTAKLFFTFEIYHRETRRLMAKGAITHAYLGPGNRMLLNHPQWLMERAEQVVDQCPGVEIVSVRSDQK